uniref:Reverse transcriptase zinc-binding domain-containing protein n=2 Tax=Aegilops tauschii subsp. strangulata TaxID=200361 RepID=A0A453CBJ1_AEGTS
LSSLLLFIMSFYSFPETLHHEIGSVQARFYWAGEGDKQKYHMVRWSEICKPRDQGGLGIMSSKRMNLALLTRWLWRIANGDGDLWLQIVRQKYLRGQPLAFCARTGGSQFWQSVIQLLPVLRIGTSISIGTGSSTLFWLDRWAGDLPFAARFPDLFSIAVDPRISVETTLIDLGRLAFRRPFGPPEVAAWHDLLDAVALHEPDLSQPLDRLSWRLEPSGRFSTQSLYRAIAPSPSPAIFEYIWTIRLPLKIRIFMWQWIRGRLPSGVEVIKHHGPGDGLCPLCGTEETLNHIFFSCVSAQFLWGCLREVIGGVWCNTNFPDLLAEIQATPISGRHIRWLLIGVLAWTIWTVRNKLVIQRAPLRRATDAVFKLCGYLQLWRPLSRHQDRDAITTIISDLRAMALRLAPPLPPPPPEPD